METVLLNDKTNTGTPQVTNGIAIYRQDGTGQYQGYRMKSQFTDRMVLVNIKVIEWNHNLQT